MLAILKSGKAYLPLDPTYPKDRLQQIIEDSGATVCLCIEKEKDFFVSVRAKVLLSDQDYKIDSEPAVTRSNIACVLYTSGSTGKPKGVCLTHAGLINLLKWQKIQSKLNIGTRTLQFCHLSFDAAFQEIFVPLCTGGTLLIIDDDIRLDAHNLLDFIDRESVNRIFLPFVTLQYLTEAAEVTKRFPTSLEEVISGGEQLKITPQIAGFFSALQECMLVNGYGPTETSVCVSVFNLKGNVHDWPILPPIGKPIINADIFILNSDLQLLPEGTPGEICISGIGLAEGYLNRPDLTSEKFVQWQHPEKGLLKIYRTGDLAKYHPDGNLEFLGRIDDQIKIRGNRVEPGEIEVVLTQLEGVKQAVVVAREDIPGQKKLIAYIVSSDDNKDILALREGIDRQLPDFMMPSAFIWLDELPKTTSGKVDKKALRKKVEDAEQRARLAAEIAEIVTWDLNVSNQELIYSENLPELFGHKKNKNNDICIL